MRTILPCVMTLMLISAATAAAQPVWEYENGPCGGTFRWIVPHDGGLVAAPYFRSYVLLGNAEGDSWRQVDLPDPAAQPFSLYSAGGRLLAGGFGRVYRTDDDGATWRETAIPELQSAQITRLTGSGDTVYACGGTLLLRSIDRGVRWDTVGTGPCRDVLMTGGGHVAVAEDQRILESTDGGETWFSREGSPAGIEKLHVGAGTIWAARPVSIQQPAAAALFRLNGGAADWDAVSLTEPFVTSMTERDGILYAGSDVAPGPQLLRSYDGGMQWQPMDLTQPPFPRPQAISALHAVAGGILAGVTHLGIWQFGENAPRWRYVTDGFFPVGVARVGFIGSRVIAYSMKENFVAYHDARDDPWQLLPYAEETRPGDMLVRDGRVMLGSASGVRSTSDFGLQWEFGAVGDGSRSVQALGAVGQRFIAGAEEGIAAWSDDGGVNWSVTSAAGVRTWYTFAEAPTGTVFASTAPIGLLSSGDGGESWSHVPLATMDGAIFDAVWWDGLLYVASSRGIAAWSPSAGATPPVYSHPAYRLCATPHGLVAATQDDGIILFPDFGPQWGTLNQGLPEAHFATPDVCRIAFAFAGGRLYFGNCGMPGLWSIALAGAVGVRTAPAPGAAEIAAVFPLPLSSHGTIVLRTREGAACRLVLYDMLGRRVRTLHDGAAAHPALRLAFDASALPPGLYRLEMDGGGRHDTKIISVIR